jgi:hypothetical protein
MHGTQNNVACHANQLPQHFRTFCAWGFYCQANALQSATKEISVKQKQKSLIDDVDSTGKHQGLR